MGFGLHIGMKFGVKVVQTGVRGSGVWEAFDRLHPVTSQGENTTEHNPVF